jgi:hypothetical protein
VSSWAIPSKETRQRAQPAGQPRHPVGVLGEGPHPLAEHGGRAAGMPLHRPVQALRQVHGRERNPCHTLRATAAPDEHGPMRGSVTVPMSAPADRIWELVSDITAIGRYSPETFEAEWLGGATEPALGARFRGHVRRNGVGPVYWTACEVTACEPGREFGFAVLMGGKPINNWHYRLEPNTNGTDVTESFELSDRAATKGYALLLGPLRTRANVRGMRTTLERIRAVVEAA